MYSAFCKFAYYRSFMTKFKSVFNKKRLLNIFEQVPSILKHVKKVLQLWAKFKSWMGTLSRFLIDHKFQLPEEGWNCKPLTCNPLIHKALSLMVHWVITASLHMRDLQFKRFYCHWDLWSFKTIESGTIQVKMIDQD